MTATRDQRNSVRDRRYALAARLVAGGTVFLGAIGVVMWPVSLVITLSNWSAGDRVVRALLADPRWKPWMLAVYAGGWVGSIVLLVSGVAFLRGRRAGRYGL